MPFMSVSSGAPRVREVFREVGVFRLAVVTAGLVLAAAVASGSSRALGDLSGASQPKLPRGSEPFKLDPADFTTKIDNPYWPMKPGSHWVYRETNAEGDVQRNDVTVTRKTKTIMGIEAVVVHDVVRKDGRVSEDTFDWYAQDADGNIWYLGEDTKEYENGKLKTTEGSWEAGVDGALAGVIVPADPKPGLVYREEYYKGHAEDGAEDLTLDARVKVPDGVFDRLLQTRNFSPLEPNVVEEKFYARGVGVVLEITVSGGSDRAELLRFKHG
jgi:hypothetical protein